MEKKHYHWPVWDQDILEDKKYNNKKFKIYDKMTRKIKLITCFDVKAICLSINARWRLNKLSTISILEVSLFLLFNINL